MNAHVRVGTSTPAASAQLDVTITNKGFLPPKIALISNESGSHTFTIQIGANTIVDTGDQAIIVVTEYKFP